LAIEAEPVEDGITHPGEAIVLRICARNATKALVEAIMAPPSGLAASMVQIVGRVPPMELDLRRRLIQHALASVDVQLRDAAVQAVELWDDVALADLLEEHSEEVQWLQTYIAEVIEDFRA